VNRKFPSRNRTLQLSSPPYLDPERHNTELQIVTDGQTDRQTVSWQ